MAASSKYQDGDMNLGDNAFAVTPSDSADLTSVCRALYVGVGGDVAVITAGGDTVTLKNVSSGQILDFVRVKRVLSTGTAATNIIGVV